MLKTITLTANEVMAVELMGGCHAKIENRGTSTIYVSKSDDVSAGADGTMAVSASATKYIKDAASYTKTGDTFDYFGTIYIVSSEDGLAEIETGNYFFNEKNSSKGGGGDIPSDVYTKDEIDTKLAVKVGKNDFASKTSGGAVKVDSGYGIEIDNNGTLKTTPAYDNFLQNFADDNHVITPYRFKKAMGLFGINSQTQISEMQTEIDSKVDNDSFVADNMIKFPYQTVPDNISGATLTVDVDGAITINGSTTKDSSGINLYTHFKLEDGVYTICANSGSTAFGVRVYGKKVGSDTNETLFSIYSNNPYTFVVGEGGFEGYEDFSINGRVTYATTFNNVKMKPMLEKGSVAHIYQPYKLSRQALRDDIDRILTALNLEG